MGFSRDHALDALESAKSSRWRLPWCLSHPPPGQRKAIERRREWNARSDKRFGEEVRIVLRLRTWKVGLVLTVLEDAAMEAQRWT
jgi:hypothetical protein